MKSDNITLIVSDNPFTTDKEIYSVERKTYRELFDEYTRGKYPISQAVIYDTDIRIEDFDTTPESDNVIIRIVPAYTGGSGNAGSDMGKAGNMTLLTTIAVGIAIFAAGVMTGGVAWGVMAGVFIGGGLVGGIAVLGGYALDKLAASMDGLDTGGGDSLNGIRGGENRRNVGGRIPLLLGRHLIYPDRAANPYLTGIDGTSETEIHLLYILGYENVRPIAGTYKFGDQLASEVTDIANNLDVDIGTTGQHPQYPISVLSTYPGKVVYLDRDDIEGYTPRSPLEDNLVLTTPTGTGDIEIGLQFPQGLYTRLDNGSVSYTTYPLTIEIASVEDPDTKYKYRYDSGVPIAGVGKATFTGDVEFASLPSDDTKIGVSAYEYGHDYTKLSSKSQSGRRIAASIDFDLASNPVHSPSGQYIITVRQYYAMGDPDGKMMVMAVEYVNFTSSSTTYPIATDIKDDLTTIGITVPSTESSQSLSAFNCEAQLYTRDYSGSGTGASAWTAGIATSNPASMFLYLLTDPLVNKDATKNEARIDWPALENWWAFCENGGSVAGDPLECNMTFPDVTTTEEALTAVCRTGRAVWTIVDGLITVIIDEEKPVVTQYFTPRNSFNFSGSKPYATPVSELRVTYINKETWTEDELIIDNPWATGDSFEEIRASGMTSYSEAYRYGLYLLAARTLRPETFTFTAYMDSIVCTIGDRVRLSHDVPLIGAGVAGRITGLVTDGGGLVTQIWVDEQFTFTDGETHRLLLRPLDPTETFESVENSLMVEVVTPASLTNEVYVDGETYYRFDLTTPTDETKFAIDQLFMPGISGQETLDLLIDSIQVVDEQSVEITAIPYSEAIYSIDESGIPAYVANITLPPAGLNEPNFSGIYDLAAQMAALEEAKAELYGKVGFSQIVDGYIPAGDMSTLDPPSAALTSQGRTISMAIALPSGLVSATLVTEAQISDDGATWYSMQDGSDPAGDTSWMTSWQGTLDDVTAFTGLQYVLNRIPFGGTEGIPTEKTYYFRFRFVTGYSARVETAWSATYSIAVKPLTTIDIEGGKITTEKIQADAITADLIATGAVTADAIDVDDLFAQTITIPAGGSLTAGDVELSSTGLTGPGFAITASGIAADQGTIGGFNIGATRLFSGAAAGDGARIQLDVTQNRFAIYDASNIAKVALGYLGGIESFNSNQYGLYIADGNVARFEGGAELVGNDYTIAQDGALVIENADGAAVARFGSVGTGEIGMILGFADQGGGTLDSPQDCDRRIYIDADELGLEQWTNAAWSTVNSVRIGGADENGNFTPYFFGRGLRSSLADATMGNYIPTADTAVWNAEDASNRLISNQGKELTYVQYFLTGESYQKFGTAGFRINANAMDRYGYIKAPLGISVFSQSFLAGVWMRIDSGYIDDSRVFLQVGDTSSTVADNFYSFTAYYDTNTLTLKSSVTDPLATKSEQLPLDTFFFLGLFYDEPNSKIYAIQNDTILFEADASTFTSLNSDGTVFVYGREVDLYFDDLFYSPGFDSIDAVLQYVQRNEAWDISGTLRDLFITPAAGGVVRVIGGISFEGPLGFTGYDPLVPVERNHQIWLKGDVIKFQEYTNNGWTSVNSIIIGGVDDNDIFIPLVGSRGGYNVMGGPPAGEPFPSEEFKLFNFENGFVDQNGEEAYSMARVTTTTTWSKFGTYSLACDTTNSYGTLHPDWRSWTFGEDQAFAAYFWQDNIDGGGATFFQIRDGSIDNVFLIGSMNSTEIQIRVIKGGVTEYSAAIDVGVSTDGEHFIAMSYDSTADILYWCFDDQVFNTGVIGGTWDEGSGYCEVSVQNRPTSIITYADEVLFAPDQTVPVEVFLQHYRSDLPWNTSYSIKDYVLHPAPGGVARTMGTHVADAYQFPYTDARIEYNPDTETIDFVFT